VLRNTTTVFVPARTVSKVRASRRTPLPKLPHLIPLLSLLSHCPYHLDSALPNPAPPELSSKPLARRSLSTPATSLRNPSLESTLKPTPAPHSSTSDTDPLLSLGTQPHPPKQPSCPSRPSSQTSHTGTRNAMTSARSSRGRNRTSALRPRV
jgi:hypothetical protein